MSPSPESEGPASQVRRALDGLLTRSQWRGVAAFLAAMLTQMVTGGGLFFHAPEVQGAIIVGLTAGLVASTLAQAALAAGLGSALGIVLVSPYYIRDAGLSTAVAFGTGVLASIGAALAGAAVRAACERRRQVATIAFGFAVAMIVVNMWVTVFEVDRRQFGTTPPLFERLERTMPAGSDLSDDYFYIQVRLKMRDGQGYYEAFREGYRENPRWGRDPGEVFSYRLPTVFWFWQLLPAGSRGLVAGMLLVATGAVVGVAFGVSPWVRLPLAIPGAAAIAAYYIFHGTQTGITYVEPWASALAVMAVSVASLSFTSSRWRVWTVVSVALGVLSVLVRELMIFVPLAGLASAFISSPESRRFRSVAWGAGLGVFVLAYALHYLRVREALSHVTDMSVFMTGGLNNLLLGLDYATKFLGRTAWFPTVLAMLGILGVLAASEKGARAFLGICAAAPLLLFMFAGNQAVNEEGIRTNYWGIMVVPILYAMGPAAFAFIPGVGVARRAGERGAHG